LWKGNLGSALYTKGNARYYFVDLPGKDDMAFSLFSVAGIQAISEGVLFHHQAICRSAILGRYHMGFAAPHRRGGAFIEIFPHWGSRHSVGPID